MARLTFSAGMFAPLADSMAAWSLRLPLGSPPPLRAATVISRRIFEKSFPRCTSVLLFFRLICDHRECPDMATHLPSHASRVPTVPWTFAAGLASAPFPHGARTRPISLRLRLRPPEVLDAPEPALPPLEGLVPAPAFACRLRGERPARPRAHVLSQVHEGQVRGARVPNVAGPRRLGQDLHSDLHRGGADVVERGLERDDLAGRDRRVEVERIQARRHDEAPVVPHREDTSRLVDVHQELAWEHRVAKER